MVIRRTVQFGLANYPELDREEQWERFRRHITEKYGINGYLRLWIPGSANEENLARLRQVIAQPQQLRQRFDAVFDALKATSGRANHKP